MGDYEQTTTVHAPADRLFDYLSDVSNLPHYFHAITEADRTGPEEVHVHAETGTESHDGEAWFKVDDNQRTLAWGSEGDSDYHGDLSIERVDDESSSITIALHTERVDAAGLEKGLRDTLEQIRAQVEHGNAPSS